MVGTRQNPERIYVCIWCGHKNKRRYKAMRIKCDNKDCRMSFHPNATKVDYSDEADDVG